MTLYIIRRIVYMFVVLIALSMVVFYLVHVLPGDPITIMLGMHSNPTIVEAAKHEWGLDKPVHVQYAIWVRNMFTGHLGRSVRSGTLVGDLICQGLPVTVYLAVLGAGFAFFFGCFFGTISALNCGNWKDVGMSLVSYVGISTPGFFLAILLISVFSVSLRLFPTMGYVPPTESFGSWMRSVFLSILTIGLINGASLSRIVRTSMLEALQRDFVRTAYAKGLSRWIVILKHAFRNALAPVLTVSGIQLGYCLGGVVVVEKIFGLPGMGRMLITSIEGRDYPVVQVLVLIFGVMFAVVNILVDITYVVVDPRVTYEGE